MSARLNAAAVVPLLLILLTTDGFNGNWKHQYGILTEEVTFTGNNAADDIIAPKETLVRMSTRYNEYKARHEQRLSIIDGINFRTLQNFSVNQVKVISEATLDSICRALFKDMNFLVAFDGRRGASYVATVLPGGRLINYAEDSNYQFYGALIFRPGQEIYIYDNGRHAATTAVARVLSPDCALGIGYLRFDSLRVRGHSREMTVALTDPEAVQVLQDAGIGQQTMGSLKRLNHAEELANRNFSLPVPGERNPVQGEPYYDYEVLDLLDLEGDGIMEVLFLEKGWEGQSYSVFRKIRNKWQRVYRGGGQGC